MANTISKGYSFGASELVTNAKLHALVDSAVVVIDTVATTLKIGSGTDATMTIQANNADENKPGIRYNHTTNVWELSNDGETWKQIDVVA